MDEVSSMIIKCIFLKKKVEKLFEYRDFHNHPNKRAILSGLVKA